MLSSRTSFILLSFAFLVKISFLFFILNYNESIFGGGNDSDYYHDFATYEIDVATSVWPVLLRYLNDIDLYNRDIVTFFMIFIGIIVVPYITAKLCEYKKSRKRSSVFYFTLFVLIIYPTLFYYSLDMYRDVFMLFVFLMTLFVIRYYDESRRLWKRFLFSLIILFLSYFLFLLRPYLGASFLLSFLAYRFVPRFVKENFLASLIVFVIMLNLLFALHSLDPILQYRQIFFENMKGDSNFGVSFASPFVFVPDFIKSTAYQLFGLFFSNVPALIVFFVESVPFALGVRYMLKNLKYANSFVWFLIVFTFTYSTVFILGNDNLGTAVRLRMFSYFSVLISCMIIYQIRNLFSSNSGPACNSKKYF